MNIPALERLRDWLLAGAPHVTFNMYHGLVDTDHPDYEMYEMEGLPSGCGTVCCIAGAAVFLETGKNDSYWGNVREEALSILGLEKAEYNFFVGHDLFDPDLAPENCTPEQAAEAVQNIIDGKEPWEGVE